MNVVLLVWDDIGVDGLSCYYPGLAGIGTTKYIDARSKTGVRFRKHTNSPVCSPFRAEVLTGKKAYRSGIGTVTNSSDGVALDPAIPTIASTLQNAGYRTHAVGKWHLTPPGYTNLPLHPVACGFQSWQGVPLNPSSYSSYSWGDSTTNTVINKSDVYLTEYTTDVGISHIAGSEPFFIYMCYNAAHAPFHCPPAHHSGCGDMSDNAYFKAMRENLDYETERFLNALNPANTIVIMTTDNGTPQGIDLHGYDPDLVKGRTFLGGVRCPMIIWGPGIPSNRTCDALTHASDVTATILDLLGLSAMPSAVDGISFKDNLLDPSLPSKRVYSYSEVFAFNGIPHNIILHNQCAEDSKYHLVKDSTLGYLMFDTNKDPFERNPLDFTKLTPDQRRRQFRLMEVIESFGVMPDPIFSISGVEITP